MRSIILCFPELSFFTPDGDRGPYATRAGNFAGRGFYLYSNAVRDIQLRSSSTHDGRHNARVWLGGKT